MNFDLFMMDRQLLASLLAGLAVLGAAVVVTWPYLVRDTLGTRMQDIARERERLRTRERARLAGKTDRVLLSKKPRKLFREIVDNFRLSHQAEDARTVQMLRMAGYRGQAPLTAFLALRVLMPLALFAFANFYVFIVLQLEHPPMVKIAAATVVGALGYFAPAIYVKNKITKRQTAIRRTWPDALDLLLICVESGMGIEGAFKKVAEDISSQCPELAEELALTNAELSYLQDRYVAYANLGRRTDLEGVKAVVTSLTQAEKYGTPVAQALRVLAQENRDMRMAEAEKKAAALPPKLTVPMILFFLPVLFAVIAAPAAIQIISM